MTDENKMDYEFVASLIHEVRAESIMNWYQKFGGIHEMWLQRYEPSYDSNVQVLSDCIVKFWHPPVVNLARTRSGFEYVGDINGETNFPCISSGRKAIYSKHRVTNRGGRPTFSWEYDQYGFPHIEVQDNVMQRELMTKSILMNPTQLPTYREDFDEYPITPELKPFMQQRLFQLHTNIIVQRRGDTIPDSQDSTNINPKNK